MNREISEQLSGKRVVFAPCGSYEKTETAKALEEAVKAMGGLDFIKPGMKIAVKLNLVSPMKPEKAATPSPVLVGELCRMLTDRGAVVTLGDSPGGIFTSAYVNHVYEVTGMKALERDGVRLNQDFSQTEVKYPEAKIAGYFTCTSWMLDADVIIDVCKLKSHGMMGMTCAAKNFFGVIPGTMKPEYHYKYPKISDFADLLVDLSEYFAPALCVCDAVYGMEGNGPTQGTPRKIGALIVSRSPHALDMAAAGIIGFSPREIPTIDAAVRRGLIPEDVSQLEIIGDPTAFAVPDFVKSPAQSTVKFLTGGKTFVSRISETVIRRVLTPRPQVEPKECIGCGKCGEICPAKAITMKEYSGESRGKRIPDIDRSRCIHCFCCQEFCPAGAMKVHRSAAARILNH